MPEPSMYVFKPPKRTQSNDKDEQRADTNMHGSVTTITDRTRSSSSASGNKAAVSAGGTVKGGAAKSDAEAVNAAAILIQMKKGETKK